MIIVVVDLAILPMAIMIFQMQISGAIGWITSMVFGLNPYKLIWKYVSAIPQTDKRVVI